MGCLPVCLLLLLCLQPNLSFGQIDEATISGDLAIGESESVTTIGSELTTFTEEAESKETTGTPKWESAATEATTPSPSTWSAPATETTPESKVIVPKDAADSPTTERLEPELDFSDGLLNDEEKLEDGEEKEDEPDDDDEEEDGDEEDSDRKVPIGIEGLVVNFIAGPDPEIPVDAGLEQIWQYWDKIATTEIENMFREVLPFFLDVFELNISSKCLNSLYALRFALSDRQYWAINLLDSFGKIPIGILEGTLTDLGNYDQCLRIEVNDHYDPTVRLFGGKYCLLKIAPPINPRTPRSGFSRPVLNFTSTLLEKKVYAFWSKVAHNLYSFPVSIGACIPTTCSGEDFNGVFHKVFSQYNVSVTLGPHCDSLDDHHTLTGAQILSIAIIGLLTITVTLSTGLDMKSRSTNSLGNKKKGWKLFMAFSALSNAEVLFKGCDGREDRDGDGDHDGKKKGSRPDASPALKFLNGIRVVTCLWLVMANTYLLGGLPIGNMLKNINEEFRSRGDNLMFQFILNGWSLGSETFFMISGLLLAFITIPVLEKKGQINFGKFVIYRWLRFTPSLMGVIGLTLLVFSPLLGSGPVFRANADLVTKGCHSHWWADILYVNNWFQVDNMCLRHSWYLSSQMQLQVLGFFVILELHFHPFVGGLLAIILICSGAVLPGLMAYLYELPPTLALNEPYVGQLESDASSLLFPTYNHLSSYFIGLLMGYIITHKETKTQLKRIWRVGGWITFTILSVSSILITSQWNGPRGAPSMASSLFYSSLHRIVWVSGLSWLVYECNHKRGGLVNGLLSCKFLGVLSRLSFQMYLTQMLVIWYYYITKRDLIRYRDLEMIQTAFGLLIITIGVSFVTYLLFEAPFTRIAKIICYPIIEEGKTVANNKQIISINGGKKRNGVEIKKHDVVNEVPEVKVCLEEELLEKPLPNGTVKANGTENGKATGAATDGKAEEEEDNTEKTEDVTISVRL